MRITIEDCIEWADSNGSNIRLFNKLVNNGEYGSASDNALPVLAEAYRKLQQQCDELLEALELAIECGMATGIDGSYPEAWDQMQSAIAKAKGGKP